MATDVSIGALVGGFRVESLLGQGAMGAVFLATDPRTGEHLALKLLKPELVGDERFRRRFFREARLAQGLAHEHVVRTIDVGEDGGFLYLAMDYVEGVDLRALLLRDDRLEPDRALALLGQVAEALDAAHDAGLVHRDVKPGNILVATMPEGEAAYICDFGLARHVSSVSSLTGDRNLVGTIDYVAPEQIEGGSIDGRADVYSLGCVLYECLAGSRPFDRETELAVVFAHLNEPPPRLSDVRPELPAEVSDVLSATLAKSPDDRYSTCGELIDAARAGLRGERFTPHGKDGKRLLLFAAAVVAAAIAAIVAVVVTETRGPTVGISQAAIGGAKLGLTPSAYEKHFGQPWTRTLLTNPPYTKFTFPRQKVAVYFRGLTDTAVEITTWNEKYKTAAGIGPCSTITRAKHVYGSRLSPSPTSTLGGSVFAYDLAPNLIFAAQSPIEAVTSKDVSTVGLYYASAPRAAKSANYATYTAINEHHCS
ncbi:MAG TPA: serine/threonine-protein kinase [Gaiellaceae bacterium]|nr:serine/threonine-protein kinase [Gaiellaceae bacterium]